MARAGSRSGLLFALAAVQQPCAFIAEPTGAAKVPVFLRGHPLPLEEVTMASMPHRVVDSPLSQTSHTSRSWLPTSMMTRDLVLYAALGTVSLVLLIASMLGWRASHKTVHVRCITEEEGSIEAAQYSPCRELIGVDAGEREPALGWHLTGTAKEGNRMMSLARL
eukprot:gnl/MRDRNA2_/MRDRNA2_95289_c0_seq1.p1 gnl/MRDRNA2_/MRDRNA2_95289_c0~~gnl/MRDRNA2_/MRDRNA2_95289_c0_seq1.p1  ORF type:complete len:165 (-),score=17.62 gnl/MRDRNA2_/MRDRNA2_95289_c0_seq1:102-596(-)